MPATLQQLASGDSDAPKLVTYAGPSNREVVLNFICDTHQLEEVVGARQLAAMMKSINRLDGHCNTLLAASPLGVAGFTGTDGRHRAEVIGGFSGFASVASTTSLDLGEELSAAPKSPVSTLFFLPGWRETLRINGSMHPSSAGLVVMEEAFVHCAKAIIRSKLWTTQPQTSGVPTDLDTVSECLDETTSAFVKSSPFVVMTSQDLEGNADASPKGDPPGFMRVLDASTIAIPDRRGNRRTDTFHNVIERPEVAFVALRPGDHRVLEVHGTARLTDDRTLCGSMAIGGKVPHAAIVLSIDSCRFRSSRAIADSRVWDTSRHVDTSTLPRASLVWTDHVKANPASGPAAAAIRAAVRERAVRAGAAIDYRHGLY